MDNEAKILAERYVSKLMKVLDGVTIGGGKTSHVVDEARRYLSDGRFYLSKGSYLSALAAASYAEGLLDSLRILGLAEFTWPEERR